MAELTPKQKKVLEYVRDNGPVKVSDIGVALGTTRKLSERWALPAVRILEKHSKVKRDKNNIVEII